MNSLLTTHAGTRRRRLTAVVVTLIGLAILAVAAVIGYSWRGELPDPVATHWGVDGEPDGFAPIGAALGVMLGGGALLVLGFGAITWLLGQSAGSRRLGAAATIWSALFLPLIVLGSLQLQRGLAQASDAGGIGGVVTIALLGSLAPAVVAALLVPGDPRQPTVAAVDRTAPRVSLGAGERATWIGYADSKAALGVGLVAAAVVVAVVLVTGIWPVLALVILLLAVVAAMSSFVVRVDQSGLTVRSALGWPRTRVPLDEVVRADVIDVSPLRDFGGWGWRVGTGGRVGIALRTGPALLVERTGGRSIAITVDDATNAAGLLNALADRARRG